MPNLDLTDDEFIIVRMAVAKMLNGDMSDVNVSALTSLMKKIVVELKLERDRLLAFKTATTDG